MNKEVQSSQLSGMGAWDGGAFPSFGERIVGNMVYRKPADPQERGGAQEQPAAVLMPVVCVHEEEEQEPEPIRRKPIVSIDGQDVNVGPRGETVEPPRRKLA